MDASFFFLHIRLVNIKHRRTVQTPTKQPIAYSVLDSLSDRIALLTRKVPETHEAVAAAAGVRSKSQESPRNIPTCPSHGTMIGT